MSSEADRRNRVVIEGVRPEIDYGRFPIKRVVGESVEVEADVFADGHDVVVAVLLYRADSPVGSQQSNGDRKTNGDPSDTWQEVAMQPLVNDRWRGAFVVDQVGTYRYTVLGWVDRFFTWHHDLQKRVAAHQVTAVDLAVGAQLVDAAAKRATGTDRERLEQWAGLLNQPGSVAMAQQIHDDTELLALMSRNASRDFATRYHDLLITVDRPRARFSAWYELFPRSASSTPGRHGTLTDVEDRLSYVASMGFDVLYLPPIHPIGRAFRKGKNNATEAAPDDVGSPWGIGGEEGGHKSIHPQLGTLKDFQRLVAAAEKHGIEIALDVALQCSPDHPYVKEHPEWFRSRPDGTIQYAENPPKKYQDIYPFDFECENWRALWQELKSIFDFWIAQGVHIFRVDNPHTKPFPFWEWCIGEIKKQHPNVLFLAEAFTRPKIMHRLAKLGFSQSYTYFSWRNTKEELTEYLSQLIRSPICEFFRPNFWPNTPDILPEYLQVGGRAAFMARLVLAATLCSNYGIYGPPFEHTWNAPRSPGSEEYLDSEKYQVHVHDLQRRDSLKDFIGRVNRIRRDHAPLQAIDNLRFHDIDNNQMICFSKSTPDHEDTILVVVNLDPHHKHSGFLELPLAELGLDTLRPYQLHDLLSDARYLWNGPRNYVELDPKLVPAHIFQIRRRVRTERDFEYYL